MWFPEQRLPFHADSLRALVGRGSEQLKALSRLSPFDIQHAAACLIIPCMMEELHQELLDAFDIQSRIYYVMKAYPSKFNYLKMTSGTVAHFHKGQVVLLPIFTRVSLVALECRISMLRSPCGKSAAKKLDATPSLPRAITKSRQPQRTNGSMWQTAQVCSTIVTSFQAANCCGRRSAEMQIFARRKSLQLFFTRVQCSRFTTPYSADISRTRSQFVETATTCFPPPFSSWFQLCKSCQRLLRSCSAHPLLPIQHVCHEREETT